LDLKEVRDDEVLGCSGITWTICKQAAPHSRQITTPTPHHSIFTGQMLFLTSNKQCQSTEGIFLKLSTGKYALIFESTRISLQPSIREVEGSLHAKTIYCCSCSVA